MLKWSAIRTELLEKIERGEWPVGHRLPAETELATQFGVGRSTIRDALRTLADDGYIHRQRGAGTRVRQRSRLRNALNSNFGVADLIRSTGRTPGTQSMEILATRADADVAAALQVDVGADVTRVERVRTADGEPLVVSTHYYVSSNEGDTHGFDTIGSDSMYDVLDRVAGVRVSFGEAQIAPAFADAAIADKLGIEGGTLLLHMRQIDYDADARPLIVSDEYYTSEGFEFTVRREGPNEL